MALEDFLTMACGLYAQAAGAADSFGADDNEPYTLVKDAIPCLVRPLSGTNAARNDRAEMMLTHRVYFAADEGFLASRRLVVGTRILQIVAPVDHNSMGRLVSVECREVVE